jgi:hypothetical protein
LNEGGSFDGVGGVEGRPFQAKQIQNIATYASDGTNRVEVTKSNLFRDSKGRVRVERFYDGTDNPPENTPNQILIYDPCGAGTSVSLLPAWHTGKIQKFPPHPANASRRSFCEDIDLQNPPKTSAEGKFEYLGHKMLDGVDILGSRTVYFSSVAAKASGAPPKEIVEMWCSVELRTPMGSSMLLQNPKREVTITISDVRQIDSGAELFEIPEGYKIRNVDDAAKAQGSPVAPAPQ